MSVTGRAIEAASPVPRPPEAGRGTLPVGPAFPRWLLVGLTGLVLLACGILAFEIRRRGIDPDELEHVHAAYCVWRGDVPYRDFFEHHAPALYYILVPLMKWLGPEIAVLWVGRGLMWLCSLGAIWLTGSLAARWGGASARMLAMALLAWTTIFQAKAIELRPDVPATLLLLLAVSPFTFATGGGSWRRFLVVGLILGLATLFTQKAIVPAAGIGLAACLSRLLTRECESAATVLARVVVPIVSGIVSVWGIVALLFAGAGAATEFWQSTWYQLWVWPLRSDRWLHLRPTLAGDLTAWLAAAAEIFSLSRRFADRETWKEQRGATAVVAIVCIASLAVVKATYPQYYLLWMPFLAALAAARIAEWCSRPLSGRRLSLAAGLAFLVIAGEIFVLERAFLQRASGALVHLVTVIPAAVPVSILLICAAALAALALVVRRWSVSVLLLAGVGMTYGVLRDFDRALWSNREQMAAIDAVNRLVPPEGRVLDGFTGYAALRPHAWYYWWINEYSLALVPGPELKGRLLESLERNPPAGVLFDANLERLPPDVLDWIRKHYQPAQPSVLWLPRGP